MENSITKDSYKEFIQKSKEYYKTIGRIWSPALNEYIVFNNVGFTHLLRKQGIPRVKSEQKRQLNLLADVVKMIADPTISIQHQGKEIFNSIHQDGERLMMATSADFWRLTREKDTKIITAVIRQIEGGSKHFFSAYSKEQKTAH